MEVIFSPWFLPTEEGKWVNLSLCDLIEITKEDGRFWVCAWNAFQSNVSYKVRSFASEKEAVEFIGTLLAKLSSR
jgi:hypothetical protein